ncbi:GNAT superfamily N-acetyltransferase [Pseudonocardia eucalypti]|uniref:GNAT family N-acetyltransferase n=1 Tax=Pseudonocardia eucalypti TaxID=648755 RepID=UPI001851CD53|nr:GNAT superfamily N-acetyltransferase [Pseudonocardia eucalypti]
MTKQDQLTVRPALPEDEAAVRDLAANMATTFEVDRDSFHTSFHALINAHGAFVLVADTGGRVGGYLLGFRHLAFFANGPIAWVEEIAVHEDLRRQGVGARLMEGFENRARAGGARLVALATRRAGDFYEAIGYEPSATYFRKLLTG